MLLNGSATSVAKPGRIDFLFPTYLQRTNVCILLYLCQPVRWLEKSRATPYCTQSCFGVRRRSGWALSHPELSPLFLSALLDAA
jgi:hypothetical protein